MRWPQPQQMNESLTDKRQHFEDREWLGPSLRITFVGEKRQLLCKGRSEERDGYRVYLHSRSGCHKPNRTQLALCRCPWTKFKGKRCSLLHRDRKVVLRNMIQTCFRREETGEESHGFRLTSGRSFIRDGEGGIWDQIPVLAPAEGAQPGLQ